MAFDFLAAHNVILSHAAETGWFQSIYGHEPKAAPQPGSRLSMAVWLQSVDPVGSLSGLGSASVRIEWSARLYTSMLTEPQDAIDPGMMLALIDFMGRLYADEDLGGTVNRLILLDGSEYGEPVNGKAGYLNQDGKIFRVFTVTIPALVDALFPYE
jgi:hypothetical protein